MIFSLIGSSVKGISLIIEIAFFIALSILAAWVSLSISQSFLTGELRISLLPTLLEEPRPGPSSGKTFEEEKKNDGGRERPIAAPAKLAAG